MNLTPKHNWNDLVTLKQRPIHHILLTILHHGIDLLLVQQPTAGRDAQHEPRRSAKHMSCDCILHEETVEEGPERRNAGASGNHDNIGIGILRKEHRLSNRPCNTHGGTRSRIAQKVRAHTLLGRVGHAGVGIVILRPTHAQTHGVAIQNIAIASAGDRIQPRPVRAAVGRVGARRDDAERLALHVVHSLRKAKEDVLNVTKGRFVYLFFFYFIIFSTFYVVRFHL